MTTQYLLFSDVISHFILPSWSVDQCPQLTGDKIQSVFLLAVPRAGSVVLYQLFDGLLRVVPAETQPKRTFPEPQGEPPVLTFILIISSIPSPLAPLRISVFLLFLFPGF